MTHPSSRTYRFGDLLALAREYWVRTMAERLAEAGYEDYRRSDASLVRLLSAGPCPIGRTAAALSVTRQTARKLVAGLERRGYAYTAAHEHDARQVNVHLTGRGHAYADAITATIDTLNRTLSERVDPAQLVAADAVLRATLPNEDARERARRLVPPPNFTGGAG